VPAGVRSITGDVQDLGQVFGAMSGADAVIHLAGVPQPWTTPDDVVFRVNTVATFNVHEAAWRLGIKRVVTASSEAALGWTYRRLAVERPINGHVALLVPNDDTSVAEPLCELLPRLYPQIGSMVKSFTGTRPAVSNVLAKQILGWQPRYSWRHRTA
jgi:hypothetical protein